MANNWERGMFWKSILSKLSFVVHLSAPIQTHTNKFCEKIGLKSWLWKKITNIRYYLSRSSTDVLQLGVGEGRYLSFLIEWIFCWIEYSRIKSFEMNFRRKRLLNNLLNWILSWNEWINRILNRYFQFLIKSPPFFVYFGHFLGSFWGLFRFEQYQ